MASTARASQASALQYNGQKVPQEAHIVPVLVRELPSRRK